MPRNFACQRLYATWDSYLKLAYVCLNDEGRVVEYRSLKAENAATEWIGGVIFLSPNQQLCPASDFTELLRNNQTCPVDETETLYAWHVSNFDFANENLTPLSRISQLHPNSIITL